MKCPRCSEDKVGQVATGSGKLDYILACFFCPWQLAVKQLETWLNKWGYRK
jgi:hypothetical protein